MRKAFVFFLLIVMILVLVGYTFFIKDWGASIQAGDFQCRIFLDKTVKISYYGGTEEEVVIPSYIDGYKVIGVGAMAFQDSTVKKVTLPETVETIDPLAFYNCKSLEEIEFSEGLESVAEFAFAGCTSLREIELPDSVEAVGKCAFNACISLERIDFGNGVTDIECFVAPAVETYSDISEFVSKYDVSQSNEFDSLFYGCNSLKEVEFGNENESYRAVDGVIYSKDGKRLVYYCPGREATEFVIPDSVEIIGRGAFSDCDNLERVVIGDNVVNIGRDAFTESDFLNEVVFVDSQGWVYSDSPALLDDPEAVAIWFKEGIVLGDITKK